MDALQGNNEAPIRIFGSNESKALVPKQPTHINRKYKYEIGYTENESVTKINQNDSPQGYVENGVPSSPNKLIGITNRTINEDLKNLDFSVLPFFKSENSKGMLLTFVDITCPACKRYTENIAKLNSKGYDVYLAPYPRSGSSSLVAKKMQNLWCENFLNKQSSLSNITSSFKGNSLNPTECTDTDYLSKFDDFVKFGTKHLNQTTPVSFTNNGITIIANHPTDVFESAFTYGQEMTQFMEKQKEVK
nr:thioredoxin fold domain-containing protein [Shewanella sp. BF02_Schw]